MQDFPTLTAKILQALCCSAASAEASSTRDPVVAPAGAVLRGRLNQALYTERGRPWDRLEGVV